MLCCMLDRKVNDRVIYFQEVAAVLTRNLKGMCAVCMTEIARCLWDYSFARDAGDLMYCVANVKYFLFAVRSGNAYWSPEMQAIVGKWESDETVYKAFTENGEWSAEELPHVRRMVGIIWDAFVTGSTGTYRHEEAVHAIMDVLEELTNEAYGMNLWVKRSWNYE